MARLIEYAIFKDRMFGEKLKAKNFDDLLNRMNKKQKLYWSNVKFIDSEGHTINISREFLEQGMTFDEIVLDWKLHCKDFLDETIHTI